MQTKTFVQRFYIHSMLKHLHKRSATFLRKRVRINQLQNILEVFTCTGKIKP